MKKYLVTGYSGFVSKHFLEYLNHSQPSSHILGVDVQAPEFQTAGYKNLRCSFKKIDLLESYELNKVIYDFQPDYVLHLASYSSVAFSWKSPLASFSNNTNIFLNLLEQIRSLTHPCRILSVGSSEEYGKVDQSEIPITENQALRPLSPYAVARVSQEMMSKVYVDGYGLDIVLTRSFNHVGPGQRDIFVISSFAKQLVEIKKKEKGAKLLTGDLSIVRDFLDVRDVVKAYDALLRQGRRGEVYNVCRGDGYSLREILQKMVRFLELQVETDTDSNLVRPNDNPIIIGSNKKICSETDWRIQISLEESLRDSLSYWDSSL